MSVKEFITNLKRDESVYLLRNEQRGLRRNLLCQRLLWLPAVAEAERA